MEYKRICPICGKVFITNRKLNLYCGEECRQDARREKDRNRRRAVRARASQARKNERETYARAREEDAERQRQKATADFIRRCNEGDISALLMREKATRGNLSPEYWRLFALAEIQAAEKAGTVSVTVVNEHSVYEDYFAENVLQSIEETGLIMIRTMQREGKA